MKLTCFALGMVTVFATAEILQTALALNPDKGAGEPYTLAGKRLVFTTWLFVRSGQLDWADDKGNSVYAKADVKAGPMDAHFRKFFGLRGIRLVAESAQRLDHPVLTHERPWEANGIEVASVLFDEGKYKLWANCFDANNKSHWCYYESSDGRNWTRPNLGLVDFQGSKENNLIQGKCGAVFKDPKAPPEERYRAANFGDADAKRFEQNWKGKLPYSVLAVESDPGRVHAILGYVSPDGLRWTQLPDPLSVEGPSHQIVTDYDPATGKYILYTCNYMFGPRAEGFGWPESRVHAFTSRYGIGRTESDDWHRFPPSQVILEPDPTGPPTDDLFTNCKTTIPGAPDEHLMFPVLYHRDIDTSSIMLFSSYDNRCWDKASVQPVFETSVFGNYDGGCVVAVPNLLELPNGDWALPYTGCNVPHKYPRGSWTLSTSLAIWPKGRLMALEAPEQGEFWTVGFLPPGRTIAINAVTKRAGGIRVEVCDFNAKPIAGRTIADATPIIGDQFHSTVSWGGQTDLGVEEGKPVILHFVMDHAKLFGLDFQ
jgi:hypothetical protein